MCTLPRAVLSLGTLTHAPRLHDDVLWPRCDKEQVLFVVFGTKLFCEVGREEPHRHWMLICVCPVRHETRVMGNGAAKVHTLFRKARTCGGTCSKSPG